MTSSIAIADPFLLRFATPRSTDSEMPGHYSADLGVWVIGGAGFERPIVEVANDSLLATQTKTMTHVESDDDDPTRFGAMETATYTKVRQEADDEDAMFGFPELQTKTEVMQERDDDAVTLY